MNVLQVIERVKGQESIVNSLEQDEKCIILMALEKNDSEKAYKNSYKPEKVLLCLPDM